LLGNLNFPNCIWEFPIEDSVVLVRPDVSGLYILNPSARLIWDILKTGVPLGALVEQFASTYDISPELAARDVERTLDEWQGGLLLGPGSLSESSGPPARSVSSSLEVFARDYFLQGKNVRVILQTFELTEEIAPRLEALPHAPSAPDLTFKVVEESDGFRVYCDGDCVAIEEGVCEIRVRLLQEIVRRCRGRDCLAVFHAGACGTNSKCVIFPASTQSGKTTLAAVLMNMGLTIYADDSVLLERDTLAVPVTPFALTVREGSWDVLAPRFPELQDAPVVSRYGQRVRFLSPLGMKQDGHCGQVGAIVFSRFQPNAATAVSTLGPLQTLLRLQESGFWVAHDEQSIRAFLAWIQSTPTFTLSYSDVDEAASIIRRLIV
jgi:hypothetical protein